MSDLTRMLDEGAVVQGAGATTFAPAIVETYGSAGMDFVWLDFEHKGPSPADSHTLEHLVRAAEYADTELLVRLPTPEPWLVRKVLDAGVQNVLLSRVETATEVRGAARAMAFTYDDGPGARGVANSRDSDWGYGGYEPGTDDPGLGVMLETAEAVENVEDIVSSPGVDFAYLGSYDLAVSLGHPFQTEHPEVDEAVATIRAACEAAATPLGRSVSKPDSVASAVEDGWRLLRLGDEITAVRRALTEFTEALSDSTQD